MPLVVPTHVHALDVLEHLHGEDLPELELVRVERADFTDEAFRLGFRGARVAGFRLGRAFAGAVVEPELDGVIPVRALAFDLHDEARPRLDDGHRQHRAVVGEHLRHPDLFAQQPADHENGSFLPRIRTSSLLPFGRRFDEDEFVSPISLRGIH